MQTAAEVDAEVKWRGAERGTVDSTTRTVGMRSAGTTWRAGGGRDDDAVRDPFGRYRPFWCGHGQHGGLAGGPGEAPWGWITRGLECLTKK